LVRTGPFQIFGQLTGGIRRGQWANPPVFFKTPATVLIRIRFEKTFVGPARAPDACLEKNYKWRSPVSFIRRKKRYMFSLILRP
jgi:hypothetical protein